VQQLREASVRPAGKLDDGQYNSDAFFAPARSVISVLEEEKELEKSFQG
jgi:hypothetical protein